MSRRFKVTKTGKVIFDNKNRGNLKNNKSKRNIRRGKEPGQLSKPFAKKVKKQLGA